MYIGMHYNVYTQCIYLMHCNVYTDTLQCTLPIYIADTHWVTFSYTLGDKPYTLCYIFCHTMYTFFCYTMYIHMLPNVHLIYIGYIHWVTFLYTLCDKPYTLCCIFCHTMYIDKNVTQCIYVQMHYNVYTQCISDATQCISYHVHSGKGGTYIWLQPMYIWLQPIYIWFQSIYI